MAAGQPIVSSLDLRLSHLGRQMARRARLRLAPGCGSLHGCCACLMAHAVLVAAMLLDAPSGNA
jgi:hypothetical protein